MLFFLSVACFCSAGLADYGSPKTPAKNDPGTRSSKSVFLRKPEELSDKEWQDLHSYQDWNLPTKDRFPLPDDAQKTPQKDDLVSDLGTAYDKVLQDKLTKGKNFNPLVPGGV